MRLSIGLLARRLRHKGSGYLTKTPTSPDSQGCSNKVRRMTNTTHVSLAQFRKTVAHVTRATQEEDALLLELHARCDSLEILLSQADSPPPAYPHERGDWRNQMRASKRRSKASSPQTHKGMGEAPTATPAAHKAPATSPTSTETKPSSTSIETEPSSTPTTKAPSRALASVTASAQALWRSAREWFFQATPYLRRGLSLLAALFFTFLTLFLLSKC